MSAPCCCGGDKPYKFHTDNYCGEVSRAEAFPPYPSTPRYLRGNRRRSNLVTVNLTLKLPIGGESCTAAQIEEWLRFKFGDNGLLHPSPISEEGLGDPLIFEWGWSI